MDDTSLPAGIHSLAPPPEQEFRIADVIGILIEGRWLLASVFLLVLLSGVFYAWITPRTYMSDALIQVELKSQPLSAIANLSDTALGGETPTTAEIEITKSRMVLGGVVDSLNLDIVAVPHYFPVVGEAIARGKKNVTAPLFGLHQYAWSGETIEVSALQVPDGMLGRVLTLRAKAAGAYDLMDAEGQLLLSGRVGERNGADTANGRIEIFVSVLEAHNGTHFDVVRLPRQSAINKVARNLVVSERGKGSGILYLQLRGTNRRANTLTLQSLVTAYQRQNVERRSAEAQSTLVFLEDQLPRIKTELERSETNLNTYRLERGSADLSKETELLLNVSVELEKKRLDLLQQREIALQRFTPEHPVIGALDSQLRQIAGEQSKSQARVKQLPDTQQDILRLTRDVQVNTGLYTALLNRSEELKIAKAGTLGNVRIIDVPVLPMLPDSPKIGMIIVISGILGILLGVTAVFVRRSLHTGVEDPADIERALGVATYASVPYSREQRMMSKGKSPKADQANRILALAAPNSVAVESLRSLRTALYFALHDASNNVIMLTGPAPGLGKSFISLNLAAVLAQSGRRVVVIDADMRRGHMCDALGMDRSPGLSEYLAGTASISDVVRDSGVEGLSIISTGARPPNPSELLLGQRFAELLPALSNSFDHVMIDTPPVLAVTDATIIGRSAGCTLVVLKSGEHPLRMIEECIKRLTNAGVKVNGAIFNQIGGTGGGYGYGYGYYGARYGYGYQYEYATRKKD